MQFNHNVIIKRTVKVEFTCVNGTDPISPLRDQSNPLSYHDTKAGKSKRDNPIDEEGEQQYGGVGYEYGGQLFTCSEPAEQEGSRQ